MECVFGREHEHVLRRSADLQLIWYMLFSVQLKMNSYIIHVKLIHGLPAAMIASLFQAFAPTFSIIHCSVCCHVCS